MVEKSGNRFLLSVIIPISKMSGRLRNFEITMSNLCAENEIQIILIHDLQDLTTGAEIRDILEKKPGAQVTLVEKFIGSPGGARNLGLNHVEGSWVNFVDSDDIFYPHELLKFLRNLPVRNIDALVSNYETMDSIDNLVKIHEHQSSWTKVALRPGLWRWTFLAKSIRSTKFSNLSMGEDQKFLYEFCQEKREIQFTKLTTYRYVTNQMHQLTNQSSPKRDLLEVMLEILQLRRSTQSNFDEFTETMLLKLFISTLIHSKLRKSFKLIIAFHPVFIPNSKVGLRYSKLYLRSWL